MSSRLEKALLEFNEILFNCVPFSERYVSRHDYILSKKVVEEKYSLCEGDPEYVEWVLILLSRSPRFLDNSKKQQKQPLIITKHFRPYYTKQLMLFLKDDEFLIECGEIISGILQSTNLWRGLQRRLDFYAYQYFMRKYNSNTNIENISPKEQDPFTADALFCFVEMDVMQIFNNPMEIVYDELFRQFVSLINEGIEESDSTSYSFYVASYFTSNVYGYANDIGQIWMERLTEDIFRKKLVQFNEKLRKRIEQI